MACLGGEQHRAGEQEAEKGPDDSAPRARQHLARRGRGERAGHAQIEHRDRAGKDDQRDDVPDIGRHVDPARLPDRLPETRAFQRDEDCWRRIRASAHLVGLAVDRDALGAHLVLLDRGRIAIGRDGLADRDERRGRAAVHHARGRRERHGPLLSVPFTVMRGVRVLVFRGDDRAGDGDRLRRIVAAPAVMRGGGRGDRQCCRRAGRIACFMGLLLVSAPPDDTANIARAMRVTAPRRRRSTACGAARSAAPSGSSARMAPR